MTFAGTGWVRRICSLTLVAALATSLGCAGSMFDFWLRALEIGGGLSPQEAGALVDSFAKAGLSALYWMRLRTGQDVE